MFKINHGVLPSSSMTADSIKESAISFANRCFSAMREVSGQRGHTNCFKTSDYADPAAFVVQKLESLMLDKFPTEEHKKYMAGQRAKSGFVL